MLQIQQAADREATADARYIAFAQVQQFEAATNQQQTFIVARQTVQFVAGQTKRLQIGRGHQQFGRIDVNPVGDIVVCQIEMLKVRW